MRINELDWETNEGQTFGYHDSGAEITIERELTRALNVDGTNRNWRVSDADNAAIATGYSPDLRAAKREAVAALAAHLGAC